MTAYIDLVNNLTLEDEEVSCETRRQGHLRVRPPDIKARIQPRSL